jgi:methyl-accepting chemotaxis protein
MAAASKEQASGIDQVNVAVSRVDEVVQSNAVQTRALSQSARALAGQCGLFQQLVGRFRLADSPRR